MPESPCTSGPLHMEGRAAAMAAAVMEEGLVEASVDQPEEAILVVALTVTEETGKGVKEMVAAVEMALAMVAGMWVGVALVEVEKVAAGLAVVS